MFRSFLAGFSCAPILVLLLMCASPAQAKRVALVIGNGDYVNVPDLKKAVIDARALGQTLEDMDFELVAAENLTRRAMNLKLQEFAAKLGEGDEALFFFAGHGLQIDGQNFLLPTDIPNAAAIQESFVRYEAVGVHQVMDIMRGRRSRVAILILDACNKNPFQKDGTRTLGGTRGLARMAAPEGTFIMYSAGVGQEALDTTGDQDAQSNSLFTGTLIRFLKVPGLKLSETARRVRREVLKLAAATGHEQRPAYYDEITGDFFFTPDRVKTPAPSSSTSDEQDEALWAAIKGSDRISDFEFYLSRFPKGYYSAVAELKVQQLTEKKSAAAARQKEERERRTQYAAIDAKAQTKTGESVLVATELKSEVPAEVKSRVPTGVGRVNYIKQVQTVLKGYNCYGGDINGDIDDARGALKRFEKSYQGTASPINLGSATAGDYEDWLSWSAGLEEFSCPTEKRRSVGNQKRHKKLKKARKPKKAQRQTRSKRARPKKSARSSAKRRPRRQKQRSSSGFSIGIGIGGIRGGIGF